jgi:thiol-disulfide isomerase/thioredoxin
MKIKKILFLIMVFALSFQFSAYAGQDKAARIEIVTKNVDIGKLEKGRIFDYEIEVKNIGTKDLMIENAYSTCGCLEVMDKDWPKQVIVKPKQSIFIAVKMDTNKVSGVFERMLHVVSNDVENKDAAWKITGDAIESKAALPGNSKTIMVFYSPGCGDCREIMDKFLPELKEKYKDRILIADYNVDNPESFAFLLDLQNKYDDKRKAGFFNPKPPAVFVANKLLYGVKEIKDKLEEEIR